MAGALGKQRSHHFDRRSVARSGRGKYRHSDGLLEEAAAAQLRSAEAAAALGTPAGEGVRAGGGEAAPRGPRRPGDWARGSERGGREIKVEIQRPRAREERRRGGEAEKKGRGGRRGQAARGLQPRARSEAATDSLQWLALTRNLKARKRGRAGEGGETERSGARGGGRGRAEPAAGAGLPRAPHIREPARG